MEKIEETIVREDKNRELARARAEQLRLQSSVRMLQIMVAAMMVLSLVLVVGIYQLNSQVLDTTAEVNGLRATIQDMFSENLPMVRELQETLVQANTQADEINTSMANGGQFTQQVDDAISRANDEMPQTFEKFFKQAGPDLIAEALEDPKVTEAGAEQTKQFMLKALDDPSIENKMKDKMGSALDDALRGMTLGGGSKSGKE